MKLFFYNTLSRKKEAFSPLSDKSVLLYTCGPTVYDYAHIGNFRTYLFEDILVRVLKSAGYQVKWVMNVTDIDDKTIAGAKKSGKTLEEFTQFYEKEFFQDLAKLNIGKADLYPRASENFDWMKKIIAGLLKKGYAYKAQDGIYFSIEKFPGYGALSKLDKKGIKPGARVAVDEYDKENPTDFALWKKDPDLPDGRPWWHIECSAMIMKHLCEQIDIHTGGVDNIFPHHENEIAQSEAYTGKKFVRYWLHSEHLLVDGKKMAKSEGNVYTLKDLEKKGFSALDFRFLYLQSHYRSKMNFTWEALQSAKNGLQNLRDFTARCLAGKEGPADEKIKGKIESAFFDNLNTPQALSILFSYFAQVSQKEAFSPPIAKMIIELDRVFGLKLGEEKIDIPQEIEKLARERGELRKKGDFAGADKVRKEIENKHYMVEDTKAGPRVLPKSQ